MKDDKNSSNEKIKRSGILKTFQKCNPLEIENEQKGWINLKGFIMERGHSISF